MRTSPGNGSCWLPVAGVPSAALLVSAAPVSPTRTALSALRSTMPSPGLVALVILGVIATPFLVIFVIASVFAIIYGGLGF
jgi:hypothetical protein